MSEEKMTAEEIAYYAVNEGMDHEIDDIALSIKHYHRTQLQQIIEKVEERKQIASEHEDQSANPRESATNSGRRQECEWFL